MPTLKQRRNAAIRARMYQAIRQFFSARGYEEVETPSLVPAPGMEPHIRAFEVDYAPELGGKASRLFLHTSPEYSMKRLLAAGWGPIFQICKVFRNGETSSAHNPEFTMVEFYRPQADYHRIMEDLEGLLADLGRLASPTCPLRMTPYERATFKDAVRRGSGIDIGQKSDVASLRAVLEARGIRSPADESYEDLLLRLFVDRVEASVGVERPCFVTEYPAELASLARLKSGDPTVAERFELYAGGLELANGFSELTDASEQRRRLEAEQELRLRLKRDVYPIDERFIEAVGRMPPSAGVAVGLDRVLMLLAGADQIRDVLLFPAEDFW